MFKNISKYFTLNLFAEKAAKSKFDNTEVKSLWWPMASNPKYFSPKPVSKTIDVSFVGANYANRLFYINNLLLSGIDTHAFGPGWKMSGIQSQFKMLMLLRHPQIHPPIAEAGGPAPY